MLDSLSDCNPQNLQYLFGKMKTAKEIGSRFSSDKVFQGFREYGYDYTELLKPQVPQLLHMVKPSPDF